MNTFVLVILFFYVNAQTLHLKNKENLHLDWCSCQNYSQFQWIELYQTRITECAKYVKFDPFIVTVSNQSANTVSEALLYAHD